MIIRSLSLIILLGFISGLSYAQIPSAVLDLESTTEGFLPPRMDIVERNNIAIPSDGMVIFNITTGFLNVYDGVQEFWYELAPPQPVFESVILSSSNFKPTISTNQYFINGGAQITSGFGRLNATVNLPIGTVVNSVSFYYTDNDPNSEMSIDFDYEVITGGYYDDVVEYNTGVAASSSPVQTYTFNPSHTILDGRGYRIDVFSSNWSTDLSIHGVKISYTLP